MKLKNHLTLCAAIAAVLPALATAKSAADISIEEFFRNAEFQDMYLSPDGKHLAASTPYKGRQNLVVVDLAARKSRLITSFEKQDAVQPEWISNKRMCFAAADGLEATGRFRYRGTFCVDIDGQELREFTKTGLNILSTETGQPGTVFAVQSGRSNYARDVYRVNTYTGKSELVTFESPGRTSGWLLDRKGVPRVTIRPGEGSDEGYSVWMRASADAKYEKVAEYKREEAGISPLFFDWEDNLYVSSSIGRDKAAIFKWDFANKKLGELVVEDAKVDINGAAGFGFITSQSKKKILGYIYQSTKPVVKWYDEDMASLQAAVDAAMPKTMNFISTPRDNNKIALVRSVSDREPTRYALFNVDAKTLEPIVSTRPWFDGVAMPTREYVEYKARDGRVIPAYLTLPTGVPAKALPLIVHIHGGPQVRGYSATSHWGRWPTAMFYASRGYAVLEPEPRQSTGYGRDHHQSGFKRWGLEMQDDITDGALHLVKEGIVDKNRMGLHGASYGGYASLQGMVKEPDLFKAANSYVAVTDLPTLINYAGSDTSRFSDYLETSARRHIGDPKADADQFEKTSPARNAHKIKGRINLSMGSEDIRVPLIHGDLMVAAMEKAGVKFDYKVYKEEAHGFNKPVNVNDFYSRAIQLFDETIGPKSLALKDK